MFDGTVSIIDWDGNLRAFSNMERGHNNIGEWFKIVGRDHSDDCFPTKITTTITSLAQTAWRQITAGGNTIICLGTSSFFTTIGIVLASNITTSHLIYGLSGSNVWSFTNGGAATHVSIKNNYNSIITSMAVTASNSYAQTATAHGIQTTVGRYWANRLLVGDQ